MGALVTLLIGHRGAGKTSYLRSLSDVQTFDLDEEIAKASGTSLSEVFARGEIQFRDLEREHLKRLISAAQRPTVIALGAGFEGPLPEGVRVLWIRRVTDAAGRCFLNRPRLNPDMSPFAEYRERYFVRERRFLDWAHEELFLPEGYEGGLEDFVTEPRAKLPWDVTLLPENFRNWRDFFERRRDWDIRRWEIRDDLLSPEEIELALQTLPRERVLYSRRKREGSVPEGLPLDWPLELGEPPVQGCDILSLHACEDLDDAFKRLRHPRAILKLAVEISDFTELKRGHRWWLEDPDRRAFLPRSPHGRWRWYRSLFGPRMPVHFFREGEGSSLDQPFLWQARMQPAFSEKFAAVLGHPVEHSRSPLEHMANIPFVAIDIPEAEFSVAFEFLRDLGLAHAAVTAPLKKMAWALAHRHTPESRRTQAANTLLIDGTAVVAHNTDVLALTKLRDELGSFKNVWLWGGGGIKSSVKEVWPLAREIQARKGIGADIDKPDLVIWATGRSRDFVFPPHGTCPLLILDLNYGDDSPGLEWAVRDNLDYQSGLRMFKLQAELQREFWETRER